MMNTQMNSVVVWTQHAMQRAAERLIPSDLANLGLAFCKKVTRGHYIFHGRKDMNARDYQQLDPRIKKKVDKMHRDICFVIEENTLLTIFYVENRVNKKFPQITKHKEKQNATRREWMNLAKAC